MVFSVVVTTITAISASSAVTIMTPAGAPQSALPQSAPPSRAGFSILNQQAITRSLDWLSTSRVRAGFLVTPSFLIYGTGGVALGRVRVNSAIISSSTPFGPGGPALVTAPGFSVLNDSRLRAGFVGGGGVRVAARHASAYSVRRSSKICPSRPRRSTTIWDAAI